MAADKNLWPGSAAVLVLKLLEERDMYGYEMIETLARRSDHTFDLKAGTLYPILHGLEAEGLVSVNDLDLVVCHQANARIVDHVAKKLKAREGLFYKNMDRYGNTSAASIPIALDELVQSGRLRPGMRVLTVGFGGGLTWAGALLRW